MTRGGHQDQALVDQRVGQEVSGQAGVHRAEDKIDLPRVQRAEQLRDQAGLQGQPDPGIAAPELGQGRGQIQRAEDQGGADADPATLHGAELVQVGAGPVKLFERLAGPGQEHLTRLGQRHPPGGALKQRRAQLGFELLDLGGHGGLCDAQPFGGPAEPAVAHHRVEVHKLPQLHESRIIYDKS